MGGILFLDLRDYYGITQVVVSGNESATDFAARIPTESTVEITGKVKLRDKQ